MAVASQVIRRILVDHARGKHREKRGGEALRITLSEQAISAPAIDLDLLALDQALTRLGAEDELAQKVVELRFFGGMTTPEIAGVLATSERTIERRWAYAKAWLHKALDLG